MTTLIPVVSDMHNGSSVGLCPPQIDLDDGGKYVASKAQLWLWDHWIAFWDMVKTMRDDLPDARLNLVFNGDITEGYHHGTTQILSANPTAQAAVVDACMRIPLELNPDAMFFVRGTEAHVGKSAAYEERIALGLQKDGRNVIGDPDTGTASWWRLHMDVQGVKLNFEHHGRMGQRPWTRPNITSNLAAEIFYEYCKSGDVSPAICVRSHLHQHVDTYDQHPVRVIQTPAWQLATAFTYRLSTPTIADIGGIVIVIQDGRIKDVVKYLAKPSRGSVVAA